MRQIVKEKTKSDAHHESWSEPAIKNKGQEIKTYRSQNNYQKDAAFKAPLH
ncbi:hypothetical protein BL107_08059 [Synechococcus sp. BL107]|nr:hypothetical protein BL107_08059 [Synechococcus sp. BL107]